jgi:hypothetical protein
MRIVLKADIRRWATKGMQIKMTATWTVESETICPFTRNIKVISPTSERNPQSTFQDRFQGPLGYFLGAPFGDLDLDLDLF